MTEVVFRSLAELEARMEFLRQSPRDVGRVELIVRRPGKGQREIIETGQLDPVAGLVGDDWRARASKPNSSPLPDTQLTLMNARVIDLLAGLDRQRSLPWSAASGELDPEGRLQDTLFDEASKERWAPAGDQLFVELDLSDDNLPPGTRLNIGDAVLEVTAEPHTGCRQFMNRFGADALRFVNSPESRRLHLRGIYARVVQPGTVRTGDLVTKAK